MSSFDIFFIFLFTLLRKNNSILHISVTSLQYLFASNEGSFLRFAHFSNRTASVPLFSDFVTLVEYYLLFQEIVHDLTTDLV